MIRTRFQGRNLFSNLLKVVLRRPLALFYLSGKNTRKVLNELLLSFALWPRVALLMRETVDRAFRN
jgi:hypothetical protein